MTYMQITQELDVLRIESEFPEELKKNNSWHFQKDGYCNPGWIDRWDIRNIEMAEALAASASELTGRLWIATDAPLRGPRFGVIEAPAVGDKISFAFNGDYYPDGEIARISKSLRVITSSTGKKYYRRGLTGAWLHQSMWSMVPGHRDERNPHF